MTGLLRSWVPGANDPAGDFPLNNLPFGRYLNQALRTPCVAIGDRVLDLRALERTGLLSAALKAENRSQLFQTAEGINALMEAGPPVWAALRVRLTELLSEANETEREAIEACLRDRKAVEMAMPFDVAEYTDFYASKHHAFNVGSMFRGPENALPPNWLHIPIGYNGRASSVVVSGTDVRRPWGQLKGPDDAAPRFSPSERFDIELELGAVVGLSSDGPLTVAEADRNIFGYVLLNDWSARDIQAWEYQPLGPFQGKATATSISPWIVTAEALRPFRVATPEREAPLLPYLEEPGPMGHDISLEVSLRPKGATRATTISRTNARELYYSAAQQLAHHASSGCPMNTGDLLGSGTVSGATPESYGSLLELSWGGNEPFGLTTGEQRSFLEDGDTVALTGWAQRKGYRIGFGSCEGTVLPALERTS